MKFRELPTRRFSTLGMPNSARGSESHLVQRAAQTLLIPRLLPAPFPPTYCEVFSMTHEPSSQIPEGQPRPTRPMDNLRSAELPLMKVGEVASLLQVSTRTVQRMVRNGKFIRPKKIGRSCRWRPRDVIAWIESDSHPSKPDRT
jgi:excisionase family DNA binding protein